MAQFSTCSTSLYERAGEGAVAIKNKTLVVKHMFMSCCSCYGNMMVKPGIFYFIFLCEVLVLRDLQQYWFLFCPIGSCPSRSSEILLSAPFIDQSLAQGSIVDFPHWTFLWSILKIHWARKPPCLWTFYYLYNNSFCTVLLEERGFLFGLFCKCHLATFVFLCQSC